MTRTWKVTIIRQLEYEYQIVGGNACDALEEGFRLVNPGGDPKRNVITEAHVELAIEEE